MKQSSDQNILQSIKKKNKFPHIISFPKAEDDYFMFHHTPAEVIYHVDGFKVKNSDKIQDNLKQMIKNSKNPFIQIILSNEVISNKQQQVDKQIVEKFSKQIGELNKQLRECNVQFVRCIKPNERKLADNFDNRFAMRQIQYLGILESIQIR